MLISGPAHFLSEASQPVVLAHFDERPRMVRLSDKKLMGCFLQGFEGGQRVVARYSDGNGQHWTNPQPLMVLPRLEGHWIGLDVLVDSDKMVHFFLLQEWTDRQKLAPGGRRVSMVDTDGTAVTGSRRIDIWHSKGTGVNDDWRVPRKIWEGYTGSLNSVVQLKSGRIVLPFSYATNRTWKNRGEGFDAFTFMGDFSSTVLFSDDLGETWNLSPSELKVATPNLGTYGAIEPVVLELKDGRVWMLIRTQQGRLYGSYSRDGAEWSVPQPTEILSSDSPVGVVRFKNDSIVLVWNSCLRYPYAYGGRHVLHAAISSDEGKTWSGFREIARDPHRDEPPPAGGDHGTGYPYLVVANENRILLTTGQGKGRVLIVGFDPAWLYAATQQDDFSEGLDQWSVFGTQEVRLVPDPDGSGRQVLSVRKPKAAWPAGAVWNFPMTSSGELRLQLRLNPGFRGALIGITDHYSVPFDELDEFHNMFNLRIGDQHSKEQSIELPTNRWCSIDLYWDIALRFCKVKVNGQEFVRLPLLHQSSGVNYLRLRSIPGTMDVAGFLVESVEMVDRRDSTGLR